MKRPHGPSRPGTIEERLDRLEANHRRSRRLAAALLVGVPALCVAGGYARDPKAIDGRRLELSDASRDASVVVGFDEDGTPSIIFRRSVAGRESSIDVRMRVADDGDPFLEFVDQANRRRYKIPR